MFIRIGGITVAVAALCTLAFLIVRRAPAKVHAKHVYAANVNKIWSAWSDPAQLRQWWVPEGAEVTTIENDLRVGGKFLICAKLKAGGVPTCTVGQYDQIENERLISAVVSFSDERGTPIPGRMVDLPGVWPDQYTLLVTFQNPDAEHVRVDVTEHGIPMIMKFPAKLDWQHQLDRLARLL